MKKLLSNSSISNSTLRGRDFSQFEKTAIHRFHHDGQETWLRWYDMLTRKEQIKVQGIHKIDEDFVLRTRERNLNKKTVNQHRPLKGKDDMKTNTIKILKEDTDEVVDLLRKALIEFPTSSGVHSTIMSFCQKHKPITDESWIKMCGFGETLKKGNE